jgi:hypothetical protein
MREREERRNWKRRPEFKVCRGRAARVAGIIDTIT